MIVSMPLKLMTQNFFSRLPLIIIMLFMLSILAYVNSSTVAEWFGSEAGAIKVKRAKTVPVRVHHVKPSPYIEVLEALGTAKANEAITLYPQHAAKVKHIYFTDGQFVKKDQILLSFYSEEEEAEVKSLEANLIEAKAQLKRIAGLRKNKAISQSAYDEQQAEVFATRAQLEKAKATLAKYVISAPFEGVLGLRNISKGAYLTTNDPITTLDDLSTIKIDFTLPEKALTQIKIGQTLSAFNVAYPDFNFEGILTSIDTRIDPISRAVNVRAEVNNERKKLKPGMLLNLKIELSEESVILLPESAIIPNKYEQTVYKVINSPTVEALSGTVIQHVVKTGRRSSGQIEVLSGLSTGDRVVIEGMLKLKTGTAVQILPSEKTEL